MSKLRVALAQTCPANAEVDSYDPTVEPFASIERNLLDVTEHVKTASQEGAEVVVFPEYFLQGLLDQGRQVSVKLSKIPVPYTDLSVSSLTLTTSCRLPQPSRKQVQRIDSGDHRSLQRRRSSRYLTV
jgi:hypothetical protein